MPPPLCFVLMPFGKKTDAAGTTIEFDEVYKQVIQPAIVNAGMTPIRADEELTRGIIHKPMYERLILCDFAVADLTTANANVFYELGIRHAVRPGSTVLLYAAGGRLPFDAAPLRSVPYALSETGVPADAAAARADLTKQLNHIRAVRDADSPIFDLLKPFPAAVDHLKTNAFQDRIGLAQELEEQLSGAKTPDELNAFQQNLGALDGVESAILVKLFLAYRDAKAWQAMIDLAAAMPEPLARTVMLGEQLALALNRAGKSDEAERVLTTLIKERGGSSETFGILGRVYKDRWQKSTNKFLAKGELDRAIDAYMKGFEADWRDAYPGVNAVTLMEVRNPPDPRRLEILPIVRYAASRRIAAGSPDYWDYATLLELAVLAKNETDATENLTRALPVIRAKWEPETTLNNLRMIRASRKERNEEEPAWIGDVMDALEGAAQ
ncbi:MAG TPA: TRAFs-binding domain-containing protein [Thermoanaerobaculia bacterium]|nr:TRAFs-binding domain-containing protein [Thermoanaerobaculia bacterium]